MRDARAAARRFYQYIGSDGGARPYGFFLLFAAACGLGAGIGFVVLA
jgi:hypothetical protein